MLRTQSALFFSGGRIRALLLCGSGHGRIVRSLAASFAKHEFTTPEGGWVSVPCSCAAWSFSGIVPLRCGRLSGCALSSLLIFFVQCQHTGRGPSVPSAQGPREGIAAQWCSDSAKNILRCRVAPSTKPHHRRRRWCERGKLKNVLCVPWAYLQHTGPKRGHMGGRVRLPPMLHV